MSWPGPRCRQYARYGTLFGLVFPALATLVTGLTHHTGFGLPAIAAMHHDPLLMIIDTAPFWLGLFASFAGARTDLLDQALTKLEAFNAEILEQLKTQNARLESQNAELVRLGSVKDQFLANMSHEIRTPLTALLGFAELLLEPALPSAVRERYAATILRNGEHLLAVLNDILDVSKIEAGKLAIERLPASPVELLGDLELLLGERAREKGLAFVLRLETPVPETVYTDPVRLRQVLLNLVSNAVKFTDAGSVSVYVRYAPGEAGSGTLAFDVVDTGIGMTEEQVGRLFQPFEQADATTNRRFGGTGLGLAISRPLAQALGGDLAVRSTAGRGSTFMLSVAADTPPGAGLVSTLPARPGPAYQPAGTRRLEGRVLLAEDGEDNRLLLGTLLRRMGLEVELAEDGERAVEAVFRAQAAGQTIDLVLMDMQMPVLDGYHATLRLRERGYTGPIVALTASAMTGEREYCLAAGCDDYRSKPIPRAALAELVRRYTREGTAPAPEPADDELMTRLAATFVAALGDRLAALRAAVAAGDAETVQTLAHQLKGAAGGYGFDAITVAAAAVGEACRLEDQGAVEARLAELEALALAAAAVAAG